jgi:undecaprenyl phosphate N,N'-diacetylbacillosamine 1-phosphate transferase
MRVETERDGQKLSDSERMLKVGGILRKLSLDELPQLFNVIRGEMSFIGPRPLPVRYLPYYTDEEIHRHDIRPGLSGWAQVNGRNFLSWERKLKYDLEYVNNISFPFDLWIFLITIRKVFSLSDVGIRGVDIPDESLHEIRKPNRNRS